LLNGLLGGLFEGIVYADEFKLVKERPFPHVPGLQFLPDCIVGYDVVLDGGHPHVLHTLSCRIPRIFLFIQHPSPPLFRKQRKLSAGEEASAIFGSRKERSQDKDYGADSIQTEDESNQDVVERLGSVPESESGEQQQGQQCEAGRQASFHNETSSYKGIIPPRDETSRTGGPGAGSAVLPVALDPYRVALERMLIRDFAEILRSETGIDCENVDGYALTNDRVDR